jgi:DNA modification methylase
MSGVIHTGDALTVLRTLPAASVQCCVTSPPYWGLRDYGTGRWEGGDPSCEHGVQRWEGAKQTQGAQSGHASIADRLAFGAEIDPTYYQYGVSRFTGEAAAPAHAREDQLSLLDERRAAAI